MRGDWTRGRLSIAHLTLLGVLVAAAVGCGGGGLLSLVRRCTKKASDPNPAITGTRTASEYACMF